MTSRMLSAHTYPHSSQSGNLVIILAVLLTGLLAIAGLSIDTALYFLKRQEAQSLAQSVAMAAALNIPHREKTLLAAEKWYDILRKQNGHEIAPDRATQPQVLTIELNDNAEKAGDTVSYLLDSITIRIALQYKPKVFPVGKLTGGGIELIGEATAGVKPTDIVMIVDNSASLIRPGSVKIASFNKWFGDVRGQAYAEQCFSSSARRFKQGVVALYDTLSQIGSFRVGVIAAHSRSGEPLILSDLGETTVTAQRLEYDGDQPDYHSTRCGAVTGNPLFNVPENLNASSRTWNPRTSLTTLYAGRGKGNLSLNIQELLLVREALWSLPSGFATSSGFIPPRYFFSDPRRAIELATDILENSRRSDGIPVSARIILVLTDDAGVTPKLLESSTGSVKPYCEEWQKDKHSEGMRLGVVYFGHNRELLGHHYNYLHPGGRWVEKMRDACIRSEEKQRGVFFVESSPLTASEEQTFASETIPLLALGLKQVELIR